MYLVSKKSWASNIFFIQNSRHNNINIVFHFNVKHQQCRYKHLWYKICKSHNKKVSPYKSVSDVRQHMCIIYLSLSISKVSVCVSHKQEIVLILSLCGCSTLHRHTQFSYLSNRINQWKSRESEIQVSEFGNQNR